jgi:hypothetical protein
LAAMTISCVYRIVVLSVIHLGHAPIGHAVSPETNNPALDNLMGTRLVVATAAGDAIGGFVSGLIAFFWLFLFRMVLRKPWLAAVAFFLVVGVLPAAIVVSQGDWNNFAIANLVIAALAVPIMQRFGLFAMVAWGCIGRLVDGSLLTTDFSAWYGQSSLGAVIIVIAVTLWALRVSLGDRPLWNTRALSS